MGPPADKLWAVDPTGVATINPSQRYRVAKMSVGVQIDVENSIGRSAQHRCLVQRQLDGRHRAVLEQAGTKHQMVDHFERTGLPSPGQVLRKSSGERSARNPSLPQLIPSTGVWPRPICRAACRIDPSPPRTMTRSCSPSTNSCSNFEVLRDDVRVPRNRRT